MTPPRAEAETFIRLVQRCRPGRLLLYLGAPSAQARRLAEAAQYLGRRGLDVVLGFLENAAGPDAASAPALESLPRQRLEYRGLSVEEMDLAAVLRRRPQVAVVQDLAHANVPGGAHARRYQDAQEMLAAGINVLASADPWHLEGLPGLDTTPPPSPRRQVLPASFWRRADQIVLLEENPSPPEQGQPRAPLPAEAWAALRGLASAQAPADPAGQPPPASQRIMVCLPAQPQDALALLRGARGLAPRDGASWFAVHVSPVQGPTPPENLELGCQEARRLGAEVVLLKGRDPLAPLLDFARAHGVRHIVLGRSRGALWKDLLKLSLSRRLLRLARDFDLHIMDLAEPRV
jgi:two-component system, OmpR family, sensor histidine kinase KdpD